MVDIRIEAAANLKPAITQVEILREQIGGLNAQLEATGIAAKGAVNPAGFKKMQQAMSASSNTWRAATASTGAFYTQQLKLNSATDTFTKNLMKQKLSFAQLYKQRAIAAQAYKEQIALQNMFIRQSPAMVSANKAAYDVAVPRQLSSELNTLSQRMGYLNTMVQSGAAGMVNWGKNTQWAGRQLMVGFTVPMAIVGAASGVMAYKVDQQLTRIRKVYNTTVNAIAGDTASIAQSNRELDQVAAAGLDTARMAAEKYGASMEDTLKVQADLAAAGDRGQALQTSTAEVMRIATLGELDYNDAVKATIALQTAFKLNTKDLGDAFNFMNATENATSLSIDDIVQALPRAANAMSSLGVSVQQMTVMLVSMRESGVEAAQAANALKSATGSILAPSHEADKFIQQITNGRIQITKLAEESGGNLYIAMQKLFTAMDGMSKFEKQQVLEKLFGKFQFNRVSAMLYNMGDAMTGTANQTKTAMDLMGQSTESWANTAQLELDRWQESVSGRFKRSIATFKAEFQQVGKPFLQVAIVIVEAVTEIAKAFNALPHSVKTMLAIGGIITALMGPIVMLIGLGANFIGTLIKAALFMGVLGKKMNLVTVESKAMELAAKSAKNGWDLQTSAVMGLTEQIEKLIAAEKAAGEAARGILPSAAGRMHGPSMPTNQDEWKQYYLAQQARYKQTSSGALSKPTYVSNATGMAISKEAAEQQALNKAEEKMIALLREQLGIQKTQEQIAAENVAWQEKLNLLTEKYLQEQASVTKTGAMVYRENGAFISKNVALVNAQARAEAELITLQQESTTMELEKLQVLEQESKAQAVVATSSKKASRYMIGSAAAGAAMAASMVLMMGTNNEIANKIGNILLMSTLAVPVVQAIGKGFSTASAAVVKLRADMAAAAIAESEAAAAAAALAVEQGIVVAETEAATVAQSGFMSAVYATGAAMDAIMGPIGWIIFALTAIGTSVYFWEKHQEKVYENTVKAHEALDKTAESWATTLGKVASQYKVINTVAQQAVKTSATEFQTYLSGYKTGSQKDAGKAFKELSPDDQQMKAMQIYVDLIKVAGLSANSAATNITALFVAAGDSLAEATQKANDLEDQLGKMADTDSDKWLTVISNSVKTLSESFTAFSKDTSHDTIVKEDAKHLADVFSEGFSSANVENANKMVDQITNAVMPAWQTLFDKMSSEQGDFMKKNNIKNAQDLQRFYQANGAGSLSVDRGRGSQMGSEYAKMAAAAQQYENIVVGTVADVNNLGDSVINLTDLQENFAIKARTLSYKEQVASAQDLVNTLNNLKNSPFTKMIAPGAEEIDKAAINAYNLAHGFKTGETAAQALDYLIEKVKADTDGAKNSADGMGKAFQGIPDQIKNAFNFTQDEAKTMLQNGMTSLVEDLASQASDNFDSTMQASLDAAQSAWDKRIQSQQDRDANEMDKFDNRWDRRKKKVEDYYKDREKNIQHEIDAEQKADDIRQKIFEAEMTRLDRLANMANTNIDFNVALNSGNLDEAAKIQNNMQAQYQDWALTDAKNAADSQSKARTDRLGNQKDHLDEERQNELDDLEKREAQEKKHLEKVQKMREEALKRQEDADMKARKAAWDADKKAYDARLDLFKSFTGRDIKDLEAWMKTVGISYSDFGDQKLKPMGQDWAQYFREQLKTKIRAAGLDIANDKLWAQVSGKEAEAIMKSFGFSSLKDLGAFVRTGKLPKHMQQTAASGPAPDSGRDPNHPQIPQANHGGGRIGDGGSGRAGVARTTKGTHPSERLVLARNNEYMINEHSYKANKGLVESINNAKGPLDRGATGGASGTLGIASAIAGSMMIAGMKSALTRAYETGKTRQAAQLSGTAFGVGATKGVTVDNILYDATQLANAATIANVGAGMNMSRRDIEIGIMTAIDESGLRNLSFGDRDSLGLFQQRPSMGWGTPEQITDPNYASRKFFEALKGVTDRDKMKPWEAAQAVQRSGTPDGSNYERFWNDAISIFTTGLNATPTNTGPLVQGSGGYHRPINGGVESQGLHDEFTGYTAVDLATPIGTNVYAVGNGTILKSYDITGDEPRRKVNGIMGPSVQDGYRSYGRVIYLGLENGDSVLYAHLSQRNAEEGDKVKGGTVIGKSGNTGYVSSSSGNGAHLHFGDKDGNPLQYLKNGGTTLGQGLAYLHPQETVMTKPLSSKFQEGVQDFSNIDTSLKDSTYSAIYDAFAQNLPGSELLLGKNGKNGTPDGSSTGTGKAGELKTGTYNVKFDSPNPDTQKDLSRLFKLADVLSLTEFTGKKRLLDPWIKQMGWGISGGDGAHNDSSVLFNKGKIGLLSSGVTQMNQTIGESLRGMGKGGAARNFASYAHLVDKQSGSKFWQIAAHTIAHIWKNPNLNRKVQQEQFTSLGALATRLGKGGEPVFLGGDLNNDPRNVEGRRPGGAQGMQYFKPLIDAGLIDNWTAKNMNGNYTMGDRYIDHMFHSKSAKLVDQKVINGLSSDHNAVLTTFDLPQLKTGGFTMSDGIAKLHDEEMVATKPLTQDIINGAKNFADGGGNTYHVSINPQGDYDELRLARFTMREIQRVENRKPRGRKS